MLIIPAQVLARLTPAATAPIVHVAMDGVIYRSEMRAAACHVDGAGDACHVDGEGGACHVDGASAWRPLLLLVPLRLGLEHLNEVLLLLLCCCCCCCPRGTLRANAWAGASAVPAPPLLLCCVEH